MESGRLPVVGVEEPLPVTKSISKKSSSLTPDAWSRTLRNGTFRRALSDIAKPAGL